MAGQQAEPQRIVRIFLTEGVRFLGPTDVTTVLEADPKTAAGPKYHFGRDRDGIVVSCLENPPPRWTGNKLIPWAHVTLVEYGPAEGR